MTKLERLKIEAIESAFNRNHHMKRFQSISDHEALSECSRCLAHVLINTKPKSNEIEIAGDAVAINCPVSE